MDFANRVYMFLYRFCILDISNLYFYLAFIKIPFKVNFDIKKQIIYKIQSVKNTIFYFLKFIFANKKADISISLILLHIIHLFILCKYSNSGLLALLASFRFGEANLTHSNRFLIDFKTF